MTNFQLESSKSIERIISQIEKENFNGGIVIIKENEMGNQAIADGFGKDDEKLLKKLGDFLSKISPGSSKKFPGGRGRPKSKSKDLNTSGEKEQLLKKLKEFTDDDTENSKFGIVWLEKVDNQTKIGLEGTYENLGKLVYSLDAAVRMNAEWISKKNQKSGQTLQRVRDDGLDFTDVVGMEEVKETFKEMVIRPLEYPDLHDKYRLESGGGVMLYGPPGCGKTYIAKAAAREIEANFHHIKLSDVTDKWYGESEKRIKELFQKAKDNRPSILFFDEIDSLAPERDEATAPKRETLGQLLTELDGFEDREGVMILGATNHPWNVDSAVTRPGRIDRTMFVPPPEYSDRRKLFEYYTKERPSQDLDYERLAEIAEDFSCADVKHCCDQAFKKSLKRTTRQLEKEGQKTKPKKAKMEDFEITIENMDPSIIRWVESTKNRIESGKTKASYPQLVEFLESYSTSQEEAADLYA